MNHSSPHLSRRSAIRRLAGAAGVAGAASLGAKPLEAQDLKGNLRHGASKWCYPDLSVTELAQAGKEMGMEGIDLLGPEDWDAVTKEGLTVSLCNGPSSIQEGFNRIENHEELVPAFEERIEQVADAGFETLICFSGSKGDLTREEGIANCAEGLKKIMPAAEKHGVTIVMELLNSKVDHPDYQCDHTRWGVDLVDAVGSDHFKLLYDIYHMQITEGDVIRTIREYSDYIAHYHTGGVPGRNEIDETQELHYPAICRAIVETGYDQFISQEFVPTRHPLGSLQQSIRICDV